MQINISAGKQLAPFLFCLLLSAGCAITQTEQVAKIESNSAATGAQNSAQAVQQERAKRQAIQFLNAKNHYLQSRMSLPTARITSILRLLEDKHLGKAGQQVEQLSQEYPTSSAALVFAADIARAQEQDTQQVIALYQQALQRNRHNYFAHNRLGAVYRQQGQFELAQQHYDAAIEAWPGFAPAYLNRAILADLYLGKKIQALDDYEVYLALLEIAQPQAKHRKVKGWIADLQRQLPQPHQEMGDD